ncbi:MAG TPA: LysR family transcriptional regulator [Stellaceae bacterium]|nr:LysR family transcriptional regulator [Stellaceae bacterium]
MDRFDSMRAFAKVVESSSFAGAAARLGISASMVTLHVKELEERLGVRLLNRTTRRVSLTETGRAYYERCTRLLADLEETEQAVSDMHAAPRGELRVNATPAFGILQLTPAIADFTNRFPAISVELMLSERMVDLIEEGFDLAVRVGELPDSSLIARQLAPCRMVVCGAPSYFEKHGELRQWYTVWRRRIDGGKNSDLGARWLAGTGRGAAQRIRTCGDCNSDQKRRTQQYRFRNSEHMTSFRPFLSLVRVDSQGCSIISLQIK